jgi:2-polyprenyl-3-methyl-5-hydroxy-6-metoxy-1,4-benzoquinol methylase
MQGLKILDLGAGEGSTSMLLSENNFVVSLEPKSERIKKIPKKENLHPIISDGIGLPFKSGYFDLIILQDVIEHIPVTDSFIKKLKEVLNSDGKIYLSTPNRFSLFNIISDPHWGLPFLSLFKRHQIKKYFLRVFRRSDYNRDDIAELFSLKQINKLFEKDFTTNLKTKYSIQYLLNGGKGIVWSRFHLWLVKSAGLFGLKKLLVNISNDNRGIINNFFTPTFYIMLKKK